MTRYLSAEDLRVVAEHVTGARDNVRDPGLLAAASARPASSAFGDDAYPTIHLKAAALLESIVRNHALVDGNKRLGWASPAVFYELNGWRVEADDDAAFDLVIGVAEGRLDLATVAAAFERWTQPRS